MPGNASSAATARSPCAGPIADSWRRSSEAGVDPDRERLRAVRGRRRRGRGALGGPPARLGWRRSIRECFAGIADDAAHLMVVSDADGTLLWLEGAPRVRLAAANSMNFAVGALWSESGAGTNAIGTALAADHAVQVFAAEHFNEVVAGVDVRGGAGPRPGHRRACSASIDLTSKMSTVHPHSLRSGGRDRGGDRGAPALPDARETTRGCGRCTATAC